MNQPLPDHTPAEAPNGLRPRTPAQLVPPEDSRVNGLVFVAPELNGRVGQEVEVRYTPHDDRQIEVFLDDRWLATARPQNALSAEERDRVLERRRADAAEQARRQRRASRQARVRLAAMTEPGVPEVTTVIGREQGRLESAHADDLALRRQARLGLLGLPEPPAPGDPAEGP